MDIQFCCNFSLVLFRLLYWSMIWLIHAERSVLLLKSKYRQFGLIQLFNIILSITTRYCTTIALVYRNYQVESIVYSLFTENISIFRYSLVPSTRFPDRTSESTSLRNDANWSCIKRLTWLLWFSFCPAENYLT